jgi:ABC-type transport system substrate-binding protein
MRIKRGLLVLVLLCIIVFSCASLTTGQPPQPVKGPRVDELLFKLYPDASSELQAFNACEIDIVDTDMDPSAAWNETIVHKPYETADMYDFELNNNRTIPTYPNWTSPIWDANFRHALAHLADKRRYVTDVLNGWGVVLDTPIMPWLQEWFNPTADKHPFNRTMAAQILDAAGYTVGLIDFRVYPLWHEKAGQTLDPLVFVSRMDPSRLAVAQMFRDELLAIGIPVDFLQMTAAQAYQKVFVERDYHIYTGGFLPFTDPDPV